MTDLFPVGDALWECSTELETPSIEQTLTEASFEQYRTSTRREQFLDEMNLAMP